jgi:cyclic pyranopterin monophosphate synthase
MKNVGLKPDTLRSASARATLRAPPDCIARLRSGDTEKGDPLKTARVAGILAAKRTDELIPLCHPLPVHHAEVRYELHEDRALVRAEVETLGPTGVEMEALAAASVAALTLYDMLKPYAPAEALSIEDTRLEAKRGGKSQYGRRLARPLRAAVVVLSDTVAAGRKPDTAGRAVEAALAQAGFAPVEYDVLPDDPARLAARLDAHLAAGVALVATVGGTGLGPRDLTVETVRPRLTTEIPGIMEAARAFGQRRTPYAMLSRGGGGGGGGGGEMAVVAKPRGDQERQWRRCCRAWCTCWTCSAARTTRAVMPRRPAA